MTVVQLTNLKSLRLAQGWSQQELGRRASVSAIVIDRLEQPALSDRPVEGTDVTTAEKLINALSTDAATAGRVEHRR